MSATVFGPANTPVLDIAPRRGSTVIRNRAYSHTFTMANGFNASSPFFTSPWIHDPVHIQHVDITLYSIEQFSDRPGPPSLGSELHVELSSAPASWTANDTIFPNSGRRRFVDSNLVYDIRRQFDVDIRLPAGLLWCLMSEVGGMYLSEGGFTVVVSGTRLNESPTPQPDLGPQTNPA